VERLFREGGPHRIRRTAHDRYEIQITVPLDADGLVGRECPEGECSPAYFKVKLGTGVTGDAYNKAFCPYCRAQAEPNDFITRAQLAYGKHIVENEVIDGADQMLQQTLGMGPTRKKKIGGGFFSMELSYKPPRKRPVGRPLEEELRRDVQCPQCTLEHAVFGFATWCPDCGADIFPAHVEAEFEDVRKMLGQVEERTAALGPRVGARDVENALEDTVSIFESVLKFITKRHLRKQGQSPEAIEEMFQKRVRNVYQGVRRGAALFEELVGFPLFDGADDAEVARLEATFEKRHPITHNLGVLDRKYLDKVRSGELEGREVRVTVPEVEAAMALALKTITVACERAFLP
jgi:hypothetical protein